MGKEGEEEEGKEELTETSRRRGEQGTWKDLWLHCLCERLRAANK